MILSSVALSIKELKRSMSEVPGDDFCFVLVTVVSGIFLFPSFHFLFLLSWLEGQFPVHVQVDLWQGELAL